MAHWLQAEPPATLDCIDGENGIILEILLIVIYIYIMIQTAKLSLCLSSAIISGGKVRWLWYFWFAHTTCNLERVRAATAQSISLVILNRLTFNIILDFLSMFLMHNLHVLDPGPCSALLSWHYGIFSTPKISCVTTLYNYISRLHRPQKCATKTWNMFI